MCIIAAMAKNKYSIPFHKTCVSPEEIKSVAGVLRSGIISSGPVTEKFENNFSRYTGAKYSVAVNSCTAALHLALIAIGIKPGDEVIVPALTFSATAQVVCYLGAKPVLVDVENDTHNMNVRKIRGAITSKTKAIIPVHYGGQPCDMDEIIKIAKKHGLYVVEDAAHCLPAYYKGKSIGKIGDITCFSFYATKPITTGEGGMLTTNNSKWANRIKKLRIHGISNDFFHRYSDKGSWYYEVTELGYKYNMSDINAALGLVQLKKADTKLKIRSSIARKYTNALKGIRLIETPYVKPDRESSWHLYPIKLKLEEMRIDRDSFIKQLQKAGICTSVHFIPLYRHPFYRNTFAYNIKDFPNTEWVYERLISLPIFPGIKEKEIEYISNTIKKICSRSKK